MNLNVTRNKKEQIRKINIITVGFLIATFIFTFFLTTFAKTSDPVLGWCDDILNGVGNIVKDTVTGNADSPYGVFYSYIMGTSGNSSLDAAYSTVTTSLKTMAGMWILVVAAINMFTNLGHARDTTETVEKFFFELFVSFLIIANIDTLIDLALGVGQEIVDLFAVDSASANATTAEDLLKAICGKTKFGKFEIITAMATLIMPYALSFLAKIAMAMMMCSLVIELGIRKILAPLAVADIYHDGLKSPGMRYLKKLVACFVKIVIAILVSAMANRLIVSAGDLSGLDLVITIIVADFTQIGMISKGGEIANEVVGA